MLTIRSKWRLLALMLPVAIVIAAVAFFAGGSPRSNDPAYAGGPLDTSGVTCTNVYLQELLNFDLTSALPVPVGSPPGSAGLDLLTAINITSSLHNTTLDQYFIGDVNDTS